MSLEDLELPNWAKLLINLVMFAAAIYFRSQGQNELSDLLFGAAAAQHLPSPRLFSARNGS